MENRNISHMTLPVFCTFYIGLKICTFIGPTLPVWLCVICLFIRLVSHRKPMRPQLITITTQHFLFRSLYPTLDLISRTFDFSPRIIVLPR